MRPRETGCLPARTTVWLVRKLHVGFLDMAVLAELAVWPPSVDAGFRTLAGMAEAGSYGTARWIFLRGLGLVYAVAFLSLWPQIPGLLGRDGILPAAEYLDRVRARADGPDLSTVPSLFWIRSDDRALRAACAAGVGLGLMVAVGLAPAPALLLCWGLYLSFAAVGQVFLSYQWDVLLLETGFLAAFLAPWQILSGPVAGTAVGGGMAPAPALFALWWLLFRLHFQSGITKLTSGDPSWRDFSALEYHWWTQPLPTPLAWWVSQLPKWAHRAATLATHVIEIGLPFLIFVPGTGRLVACAGIVLLQLLIFATGNYNFFNLLALLLALLLLPDPTWASLLPGLEVAGGPTPGPGLVQPLLGTVVLAGALGIGLLRLWRSLRGDGSLPRPVRDVLRRVDPWRTVNSYGLFRVMTKRRPEIVVEGSRDGDSWEPYRFRWKPSELRRRPRFCAPHQPRLDWQMWFAALSTFRRTRWFQAFLEKLLQGDDSVTGLLRDDPFAGDPPRYVRAVLYEYRFTSLEERRRTERWWKRERKQLYAPPMSLRPGGEDTRGMA